MELKYNIEYECQCKKCGAVGKNTFGKQDDQDDSKHKPGSCPIPGCNGELKFLKQNIDTI